MTSVVRSTDANRAQTLRTEIEFIGTYEYHVAGQTHVGSVTAQAALLAIIPNS